MHRGDNRSVFLRGKGAHLFEATDCAAGPWDRRYCHGGAPAALLASIAGHHPAPTTMAVARFTVDLVRPVPIGEQLTVETSVVHEGRRTQLLQSILLCGDTLLARSTCFRVRVAGGDVCAENCEETPDAARHQPMPGGFSDLFTIVPVTGGFGTVGPADAWFRFNGYLIGNEPSSPLERAVACADFGSGIAHQLDFADWLFPSLDLSINFARQPVGDWIRLQSRWIGAVGGHTCCSTSLGDLSGAFGHAMQTVLIEPRDHQ